MKKKLFKIKLMLTQNKYKYTFAVVYININYGSVRDVAALYRLRG